MRRLFILAVAVATLGNVAAQKPWSEYEPKQQKQIVGARHTHKAVREAYNNLEAIDDATLREAWEVVSTPTRDKHAASLHLYLYEKLRARNGTTAAEDIAILGAYAEYMLCRMEDEAHRYDIYNYAFALGRYDALHGKNKSTAALRPMFKRRLFKRHAASATTLRTAIELARRSEALGLIIEVDFTSPTRIEHLPSSISRADYEATESNATPIIIPNSSDDIEKMMISECHEQAGAYNIEVSHNADKNIKIIATTTYNGKYLTICDDDGTCITLPHPLYTLSDGRFFAVGDGKYFDNQVIVGRIADGTASVNGSIALPAATYDIRCNERGIYLHATTSDDYLFIDTQ